ncbi:MAG: alkaline phosphatase family protein [Pseudomonadota bacterium]
MKNRVLWINLKGADWALIQPLLKAGKLPNFSSLIAQGSYGQIFAVPPRRFPASVMTLATGTEPHDHHTVSPIIATDSTDVAVRPFGLDDLGCPPVWEAAAAAGRLTIAMGWPGTHPASSASGATVVSDGYLLAQGAKASEWPMDPDSVSDKTLIPQLTSERLHPRDVRGEMLRNLLDSTETIDTKNDERIQYLIDALSRAFSLHRAACWMVSEKRWDFFAIHFDLLDCLSQFFLQYQAPKMGHVTSADHARYAGVVDAAYGYVDRMLAPYVRAANAAGGNIIVTSDHGYLTGELRKRPTALEGAKAHLAYRDAGIIVTAGGAFEKGRSVSGAMTTSVAPTILAALGCAAPPYMKSPVLQSIMTSSAPKPVDYPIPKISCAEPPEAQALLALAYLERRDLLPPMPKDRDARLEAVRCSQLTRLAQCNITAKRHKAALGQLAEAQVISPSSVEAHVLTAQCSIAVSDWDRATQALDALDRLGVELPMALYFRGRVAAAQADMVTARDYLAQAEEHVSDSAEGCKVLESIGNAYFDMQAPKDAARCYERALRIDSRAPRALSGLGAIHLATQDFRKALACFQASLSTLQKQPLTQALRGQALLGLGQLVEAKAAFETALSLAPTLDLAQRGLADLAEKEAESADDILQTGLPE